MCRSGSSSSSSSSSGSSESSESESSSEGGSDEDDKNVSREDMKLQYYIQLFERQAAQEARVQKRKEDRKDKRDSKKEPKKKYQGKKNRGRVEGAKQREDSLKIELIKNDSTNSKLKEDLNKLDIRDISKASSAKNEKEIMVFTDEADKKEYATIVNSEIKIFTITKRKFEPEVQLKDKDAIILVTEEDSQSDMQVDEDNDEESSHHTEQIVEPVQFKETACCTSERIVQIPQHNYTLQAVILDNDENDESLVVQSDEKKALDNPQEFEDNMHINKVSKIAEFTEKQVH
jgi:hypothetical protein